MNNNDNNFTKVVKYQSINHAVCKPVFPIYPWGIAGPCDYTYVLCLFLILSEEAVDCINMFILFWVFCEKLFDQM